MYDHHLTELRIQMKVGKDEYLAKYSKEKAELKNWSKGASLFSEIILDSSSMNPFENA